MSADSHGGPSSHEDAHVSISDDPMSREAMESSVLDALRPLLRAKRKGEEGAVEEIEGADRSEDTSEEKSAPEKVLDELEAAIAAQHAVAPTAEPANSNENWTTTMDDHMPASRRESSSTLDLLGSSDVSEPNEFDTFLEIGEDLERRSRRSATMARLLEQHHHQLQTAEKERDDAYDKLARVYPVVQETARALKDAMDTRKVDQDPSKMARLFQLNGRALDELEKVSVTLFADFLWCKSAWEQYAKTVEDARVLRAGADS